MLRQAVAFSLQKSNLQRNAARDGLNPSMTNMLRLPTLLGREALQSGRE
jgi:hypothetical protein